MPTALTEVLLRPRFVNLSMGAKLSQLRILAVAGATAGIAYEWPRAVSARSTVRVVNRGGNHLARSYKYCDKGADSIAASLHFLFSRQRPEA